MINLDVNEEMKMQMIKLLDEIEIPQELTEYIAELKKKTIETGVSIDYIYSEFDSLSNSMKKIQNERIEEKHFDIANWTNIESLWEKESYVHNENFLKEIITKSNTTVTMKIAAEIEQIMSNIMSRAQFEEKINERYRINELKKQLERDLPYIENCFNSQDEEILNRLLQIYNEYQKQVEQIETKNAENLKETTENAFRKSLQEGDIPTLKEQNEFAKGVVNNNSKSEQNESKKDTLLEDFLL